jgi:hypothetical protein
MLYGKELWGMSSVRAGRARKIVRKALVLIFRTRHVFSGQSRGRIQINEQPSLGYIW